MKCMLCVWYQKVITVTVAPITTFYFNSKVHMSSVGLVSCNARPPRKKVQKNVSRIPNRNLATIYFYVSHTQCMTNAVWWDAFRPFGYWQGLSGPLILVLVTYVSQANSMITCKYCLKQRNDEAEAWPWNLTKPLINWVLRKKHKRLHIAYLKQRIPPSNWSNVLGVLPVTAHA